MSAKRILKRRSSSDSENSHHQSTLPTLTSPTSEFVNLISNDMAEVYNCASSISQNLLDRGSDTIRLPSIHELDKMIDSSDRMARVLDDAKLKWFSPSEVTHESTGSLPHKVVTESCMTQRAFKQRRLYPAPKPRQQQQQQQQQPAQCHSCKSTETPEWRKGPLGPRTLCNACGLIWIKLCKEQEQKKNKHKKTHATAEPCSASDSQTTETSDKYTLSFLLC